jgi:hypothetical protein
VDGAIGGEGGLNRGVGMVVMMMMRKSSSRRSGSEELVGLAGIYGGVHNFCVHTRTTNPAKSWKGQGDLEVGYRVYSQGVNYYM